MKYDDEAMDEKIKIACRKRPSYSRRIAKGLSTYSCEREQTDN
jgi:hypothetical protein